MELYEWDRTKNQSNVTKHGVDFASMHDFDWETAVVSLDDTYEEPRWVGQGFIGSVLHVVVFAERGERLRIISLRQASAREKKNHAERKAAP